jgi:DNA-binding NarL/FixJ family response regulator
MLPTPLTVFAVIDVRVHRDLLVSALAADPRVRVVGTGAGSQATLAQVDFLRPAVVLIDCSAPDVFGIIRAVRALAGAPQIVLCSVAEDDDRLVAAMEAGAVAYVPIDSSIDSTVQVMEKTVRHELACPPRLASALVQRLSGLGTGMSPTALDQTLSIRERQVLRLVRDGLSNKEVAQQLHIADVTVKNHVHRLLMKLKVATRMQAVARVFAPSGTIGQFERRRRTDGGLK